VWRAQSKKTSDNATFEEMIAFPKSLLAPEILQESVGKSQQQHQCLAKRPPKHTETTISGLWFGT